MNVKCPVCRTTIEWETSKWRPFCSEKCKQIDLGAWASEEYFIPGGSEEEEDEKNANKGDKEESGIWSE